MQIVSRGEGGGGGGGGGGDNVHEMSDPVFLEK